MTLQLDGVLAAEPLAQLRRRLLDPQTPWRPGRETAGWHARTVKNNRQLDRQSPLHAQLAAELDGHLRRQPLLQAAALPRQIHGILFSCCGPGEGYGRHVDNAWMAGGRADLSFTLFLSPPDAYSGGDLVLETAFGEQRLRLPAGSACLYPSTLLHRVEPVLAGERLVAVGWIESRIRSQEQRELLFDLDTACRLLFQQGGKTEAFDLISRSYANLRRMWDQ